MQSRVQNGTRLIHQGVIICRWISNRRGTCQEGKQDGETMQELEGEWAIDSPS